MAYDQPDSGAGFKPSDHPEWIGQVFLIWPTSEETVTFTRDNGDPDPTLMVTADIAIITVVDPDTGKPVFIKDAKVGGKALAGTIRPTKPNREILGTLQTRAAPKGKAYYLDVPDSNSPQWQQMCSLADQYQAQFPRPKYDQGAPSGGQAAWQTAAPAQAAWNTSAPVQAATAPAPAWGAPASAAPVTATAPAWGAPAAPAASGPPAAVQNNVTNWPPGLADFLASKGYDVNQIPDEGAARQLASTLSN